MKKLSPVAGTFAGCFGCGPDNPRGLRLEFLRDGDAVVSHTSLGLEYAGYRSFIHGGVIAAILDEAMGWALLHLRGRYGVTRSMTVDYRRPVRVASRLTVRAGVDVFRDEAAEISAMIRDHRGRVLASAASHWSLVRNARAI
jgi:acyl-coenzyme A thioesterase PaaI-like protein